MREKIKSNLINKKYNKRGPQKMGLTYGGIFA